MLFPKDHTVRRGGRGRRRARRAVRQRLSAGDGTRVQRVGRGGTSFAGGQQLFPADRDPG